MNKFNFYFRDCNVYLGTFSAVEGKEFIRKLMLKDILTVSDLLKICRIEKV